MPAPNPVTKDVFVAFQVIPRLKEGNNFEVVDKAIEVVMNANVPYQVGALEVITNIKIHSKTEAATDTFCTYDRGVTKANHMFC